MAATSQTLIFRAPVSLSCARLDPSAHRVALRGRRAAFPAVAAASTSMASSESEEKKEAKLWGGRFEEGVTDAVERFTESISYDWQLYKYDIMGSKAHATMLSAQVPLARSMEWHSSSLFVGGVSYDSLGVKSISFSLWLALR
jgi:argininosuccinate lyase